MVPGIASASRREAPGMVPGITASAHTRRGTAPAGVVPLLRQSAVAALTSGPEGVPGRAAPLAGSARHLSPKAS